MAHRVVHPPQAASRRRPHPVSSRATSVAAPCFTHFASSRRAPSLAASRCYRCRRSPPGGHGRCRQRHHEIRSGQTRSELPPAALVLPSFLGCCMCMFQVFHVDVAKVDRDVAYVAMTIHVCCKRLFQLFQLFQTDVARVLSRCCICFTHVAIVSS